MDFTKDDVAFIFDGLMKGLGFADGYVAQGGDIGSMVSTVLGKKYETCKGESGFEATRNTGVHTAFSLRRSVCAGLTTATPGSRSHQLQESARTAQGHS